MLSGVILLWFILTALSVVFVAVDIRSTPESRVLKWAFVLISAYTGPFGAFFYVLGCREPLPGMHEAYVAARWRQVLGSTMHCVAGDGIGILTGAVIGSVLHLSTPVHVALEYFLGFGFGWTIFQALFMRDMAGGSFGLSLRSTFLSEFLSMNTLMAGMVPAMLILERAIPGSDVPRRAEFWFVMSVALLTGAVVAYPMNWWLVAHHLKHGMMTVQKAEFPGQAAVRSTQQTMPTMDHAAMGGHSRKPTAAVITWMAILSIALLAVGIVIAAVFSARP